VAFDCPCWDCDSTDRTLLPVAAAMLERHGHHPEAARCRELLALERRLDAEDDTFAPTAALGEHYDELYFARPAAAATFAAAREASGLGEETWARAANHAPLFAEMYVDRLPLLAKLAQPSLVVHGRADLVATPAMLARYRADVPGGRVHTFERSAHFPSVEEPEAYADVIAGFVKENAG
jgi:proline iminopeptidase